MSPSPLPSLAGAALAFALLRGGTLPAAASEAQEYPDNIRLLEWRGDEGSAHPIAVAPAYLSWRFSPSLSEEIPYVAIAEPPAGILEVLELRVALRNGAPRLA